MSVAEFLLGVLLSPFVLLAFVFIETALMYLFVRILVDGP
jgi:hypothetical protein